MIKLINDNLHVEDSDMANSLVANSLMAQYPDQPEVKLLPLLDTEFLEKLKIMLQCFFFKFSQ